MAHSIDELREKQALPLDVKIQLTIARVRAWVNEFGEDGCYISFSGGKDSTVLMDIVRNRMGYNIPAMFVNVPTQFPELKTFALTWDNVDVMNPKISFMEVCDKYGFPLISKETADCVQGARKYLKNISSQVESLQTDRQTDRQAYHYFYDKLTGQGKYQKTGNIPNLEIGGGRTCRVNAQGQIQEKRKCGTSRKSLGNEHKGQQLSSKGEYP